MSQAPISSFPFLYLTQALFPLSSRANQVMYRGVQKDEERQAEKRRLRAADLEANKAREAEFQQLQPTAKASLAQTPTPKPTMQ